MKKAALFILALAVIFALAGCGKKTPEPGAAGKDESEKAAVESKPLSPEQPESDKSVKNSSPAEDTASGKTPAIVIKTQNQATNQEAGAMLDALDKQLTELLNTLERLEDVKDEDLQYEGVAR